MALVKLKTNRCPTSSHLTEALEESCQAGVCGVHCVYALCVCIDSRRSATNQCKWHACITHTQCDAGACGRIRKLAANDASIAASYELQNVEWMSAIAFNGPRECVFWGSRGPRDPRDPRTFKWSSLSKSQQLEKWVGWWRRLGRLPRRRCW